MPPDLRLLPHRKRGEPRRPVRRRQAPDEPELTLPDGLVGKELEADLAPMPIEVGTEPDARVCVVMVMADDFVAVAEMDSGVDASFEAVADRLAGPIAAVVEKLGPRPRRLTVRHPGLVEPLTERLGAMGVKVRSQGSLPRLDDALASLRREMSLLPHRNVPMVARTWKTWGLPDATVARLFQAAATFAKAAPWTHLWNAQALVADMPHGGRWHVSVLGNAGEMFGLAAYAAEEDLDRQFQPGVRWLDEVLSGVTIFLTFNPLRELPRVAREVRAKGWPLAGPKWVPGLMVFNAPWAGVTPGQADDVALLLRAIPSFVDGHQALLDGRATPPEPITWRDEASGVSVTYAGLVGGGPAGALWPIPAALTPCAAQGPAARPEASLLTLTLEEIAAASTEWVGRFEAWRGGRRLRSRAVQMTAEQFIAHYLAGSEGVTLPAVTEMDLRRYLFDWFPRKVITTWADAKKMPAELAKVFEFLADEGIACPWAAAILADTETYKARWESCPGHHFWDEGVEEWRAVAEESLDGLVLLPDPGLGTQDSWGGMAGPDEAELYLELGRRWLLWRDEVIRGGVTAPHDVRKLAVQKQRAWETAGHPGHRGKTPVQVVQRERRRGL